MNANTPEVQIKQFVADGGTEYDIVDILSGIHKTQEKFIANNETAVGPSDQANAIVEYDYGWRIMLKENLEIVGRVHLQEYDIGILITCRPEENGTWEVVNEFMSLLFSQMETSGFTIRPYKGRKINVIPKAFSTELVKVPIQPADKSPENQSSRKDDLCKVKVPKTPKFFSRWKKAFKIIMKMNKVYAKKFEEGYTNNPIPSTDEYRDGLFSEMKWRPSRRTVDNIIQAGVAGCLN